MIAYVRMEVALHGLNAKSASEVAHWVYDRLSDQKELKRARMLLEGDVEIEVIEWAGNENP